MKLLYLSKIGEHYWSEEGTAGVRMVALGALEADLKRHIVDKANAEAQLSELNSKFAGTYQSLPVVGETPFQRVKRMQNAAIEQQKMMSLKPQDKFALERPIRAVITNAEKRIQLFTNTLRLENAKVDPDGSIDWSTSHRVVEYDRDLARQNLTKLRFSGGRIYTDDAYSKLFDTTNMVTHFSGPGKAIYVMSQEGHIHASSHSVGYRHHSSLLAGKETAGAGELEVKAGVLTWISNKSGHYQPNLMHFLQVLHVFEKKSISNTFRITYFRPGGKRDYPNTVAFQAQLRLDNEEWDFEFNKLMLYSHHLNDEVLNKHTPNQWRWRHAWENEQPGVYDSNSNTLVPHRDVRKWLKSRGLIMKIKWQSGLGR